MTEQSNQAGNGEHRPVTQFVMFPVIVATVMLGYTGLVVIEGMITSEMSWPIWKIRGMVIWVFLVYGLSAFGIWLEEKAIKYSHNN